MIHQNCFYKSLLLLLIAVSSCFVTAFFLNPYPKIMEHPLEAGDDPGIPLLLTPLIEAGKIDDAQMASEVYFNGFLKKKSYSGYFTVDKTFNSNIFFWFFPSENNDENAPVLLWLQGGPGATSLLGLFAENGPFSVKIQHGLKERPFAWTKTHSVIYMDNPVGTGYSFTKGGFAQNQTKVGKDLYEALLQFFTMFPQLQSRDFYVTGESYAGKYIPAVAYTIHRNNPIAKLKINLKGVAIGNGFCDPINQLKYGDYLYQIGLYDAKTRDQSKILEQEGIQMIQNEEWEKATNWFNSLIDGDSYSFFSNVTGFEDHYNFIYPKVPLDSEIQLIGKYVQQNDVRAAIHVGNATFNTKNDVEQNLVQDLVQSVAPWIAELLNYCKVLIYNGQLDIIVAYPLTLNFLQTLNFSGANEYKTASRYQWKVDQDIAGFVKQAGNLTEILVRDAGHMVPADQPHPIRSVTKGGFAQNQTKVGKDLYEALLQFFTIFPDLQLRDFYVTGESYAGKYIPAVAYTIHQNNPIAKLKINLKGIAIGNGFCDPINQLEHGDYLYQLGLYDANTRDQIKKLEQEGIQMIKNQQWENAANWFDSLIDGDSTNTSFFKNVSGFDDYYNFLYPKVPLDFEIKLMGEYVQRNDVRAAIHVGNATFNTKNDVEQNLVQDSVQSVAPWIAELLNYYKVLIYNGQLDIIVAYPLTLNFLQKLNFSGADEYKTASRYQWMVDQDIAGYVKQAGNLTEILVRDAGHMVPADQPQWAFDMISRFISNKPFH